MSKDKYKKIHDDPERDSNDSDSLKWKDSLADVDSVIVGDKLKLAITDAIKDAARSGRLLHLTTLMSSCIHDSEVAADFFETRENTELEVKTQYTLKSQNDSKYSTESDEIFTQLHDADRHIAETRQNTVRLGAETRSMLDDLRKQLG